MNIRNRSCSRLTSLRRPSNRSLQRHPPADSCCWNDPPPAAYRCPQSPSSPPRRGKSRRRRRRPRAAAPPALCRGAFRLAELRHHLHQAYRLQRIGPILPRKMGSTAAKFFRQNRARHNQRRHCISGHAAQHHRQQRRQAMRDLQAENNRRQRHARASPRASLPCPPRPTAPVPARLHARHERPVRPSLRRSSAAAPARRQTFPIPARTPTSATSQPPGQSAGRAEHCRATARRYCRIPRQARAEKTARQLPMPMPPMAGHHIQCTGSRSNRSSKPYIILLSPAAATPTTSPSRSAATCDRKRSVGMACWAWRKAGRDRATGRAQSPP